MVFLQYVYNGKRRILIINNQFWLATIDHLHGSEKRHLIAKYVSQSCIQHSLKTKTVVFIAVYTDQIVIKNYQLQLNT